LSLLSTRWGAEVLHHVAGDTPEPTPEVVDAVDFALRRMAAWLLTVCSGVACLAASADVASQWLLAAVVCCFVYLLCIGMCVERQEWTSCLTWCEQGHGGPKHETAHGRAVGAATLSYFRNRASSPRDMSAAAASEMRKACDAVLQDTY
jgi:hypothetical protein